MTLTIEIPDTTISLTMHLIYVRSDGVHDVIAAKWEEATDGDVVDMNPDTRKVQ